MTQANLHEAILWESVSGGNIRCMACAHRCVISLDKHGICGTRKNIKGGFFSTVYEFPIAVHVDPIEKKPLFHFLPGSKTMSIGTAGCNFKCSFCQNFEISQMRGDSLSGQALSINDLLDNAQATGCESIAYTYNEPVVFLEYVLDTAQAAHQRGIKNVYISNGFESEESIQLLTGNIDAMNIDLKAFTDNFYLKLCKGRLDPVLENIHKAYENGIWIEITTLLIPGANDSDQEIRAMAAFIASVSKNIPWHLSRFFPSFKMTDVPPTPLSRLERARKIGLEEGLHFVYVGNVPKESNTTYCPQCDEILIVRDGYQISQRHFKDGHCLHCGLSIPGIY